MEQCDNYDNLPFLMAQKSKEMTNLQQVYI